MKKISILSLLFSTILLGTCTTEEAVLTGSISGLVKDAQTRQPLDNVSVSLKPGGQSKLTAGDGAYSFDELDAGEYTLTYSKPEYLSVSSASTVQPRVNTIVDVMLAKEPLIPVLAVNDKSLEFGKDLETLSLEITNTGKGSLDWHIEYEPGWFSCSPLAGSTEKEKSTVVVTVNRNQMEKGPHRKTFTIASNGGREDITVNMEVAGVNLAYEPSELDFGTLTSALPLTLTHKGNGTVTYEAEASNSWIVLGKYAGQITTTDYIQVMVNRGKLSAGSYSGSISIRSGQEKFAVPVKMSIATMEKPVVGLNAVDGSRITYNSAALSGIMVSVGSQKVTRYGFCWSTSPGASVEGAHSDMGDCAGPTAFEGIASGLQPNTLYYVRAYAQNVVGLAYSPSELSFTTVGLPTPATVPVGSVSITPASLSRQVGDPTVNLTATVLPDNATNKSLIWASGNTGVATVSNGAVGFVGAGTATITATSVDGGKTATCQVTVTSPVIPVSGISLNQNTLTLGTGATGQLIATVLPANASNRDIRWASSTTSVATVSSTGLVTAVSAGNAVITVTTDDGRKTASCTVTVAASTIPVTGVSLNQSTLHLGTGATGQLIATVSPSNATNKNISWASTNTSVATVSTSGLVTAVSAGNATISATTDDGGKTATCQVTVTPVTISVTGVSLNQTSLSGQVNDPAVTLTATVSPSNATNKSVTWATSNATVATVSNGIVNFVGAGSATITVTTADGGKTATCQVTVTPVTIPVTGVSLNQTSLTLTTGSTSYLTATVSPSNASNKKVSWQSSNTSVATVSASGPITAVSAGRSNITVTTADGNRTATCIVNVEVASGKIGNLFWTFSNGELTISGVGDMDNYCYCTIEPPPLLPPSPPWEEFSYLINAINIKDDVTSIGDEAFYRCSSLNSITIPNSVTSIGKRAFVGCTSLSSITIPNSVKSIGEGAFSTCSNLTSITIPNLVTSIGPLTFNSCSSLSSITIPNSVTNIENGAFYSCSSLSSITIPNSVTSIGGQAFYGCSKLKNVRIENSVPPSIGVGVVISTFNGVPLDTATLTVPKGSKAAYQSADGWKDFKTIVEMP